MNTLTRQPDYETHPAGDHPWTLSFRSRDRILCKPYHHLRHADFIDSGKENRIELVYDDFHVTMEGTGLTKLWEDLCLYRLREVRVSQPTATGEELAANKVCRVEAIEIRESDRDQAAGD